MVRACKDGTTRIDYRVSAGSDATGKKLVWFRATEQKAKELCAEISERRRRMGELAGAISPAQVVDAASALSELADAGMQEISLTEAVRRCIAASGARRSGESGTNGPVVASEAFKHWLERFNHPGQGRHMLTARSVVGRFLDGRSQKTVASFTTAEVREFIETTGAGSPVTYNNVRAYLHAFFGWAVKTGAAFRNVVSDVEKLKVPYREPKWLQVDKVEALFREAEGLDPSERGAVVARMALGFFAGVRSAEIDRINWANVNLDEGEVRVALPKGSSQGHKPRIVTLSENAIAWLKTCDRDVDACVAFGQKAFSARFNLMCLKCGVKWEENYMRHTFATMHVAQHKNSARTAFELGHGESSKVLDAHYRGLASRLEAERFWKINPLPKEVTASV